MNFDRHLVKIELLKHILIHCAAYIPQSNDQTQLQTEGEKETQKKGGAGAMLRQITFNELAALSE